MTLVLVANISPGIVVHVMVIERMVVLIAVLASLAFLTGIAGNTNGKRRGK
jgi:hypothetical protein